MSCNWPFHNNTACTECQRWETLYGKDVDAWLETKAEVRRLARAQRAAQPHGDDAPPPEAA